MRRVGVLSFYFGELALHKNESNKKGYQISGTGKGQATKRKSKKRKQSNQIKQENMRHKRSGYPLRMVSIRLYGDYVVIISLSSKPLTP